MCQSLLTSHTRQSCLVKCSYPGVGTRETWYTPETWLACFLLASTGDLTATGNNCEEEADLGISMIFTNLVFYSHYRVWTSTTPFFGLIEGVDSPLNNV